MDDVTTTYMFGLTCNQVLSDSYFNGVFVYDTHTDSFGIATASATTEPCLLPTGCGPYRLLLLLVLLLLLLLLLVPGPSV